MKVSGLRVALAVTFHKCSLCLATAEATENYNSQFWNRLQNEWKKISEEDDQAHPWLSEFNDYYDPYKVSPN